MAFWNLRGRSTLIAEGALRCGCNIAALPFLNNLGIYFHNLVTGRFHRFNTKEAQKLSGIKGDLGAVRIGV
ncbi:hypothetical protein AM228_14855 [Planktothricoides sp. SR001]|nr:hypothetical protein AM228_14855 [Planktothricoides sp. SR001]